MSRIKEKIEKREGRKRRVRARILGTSSRPRLTAFRSNRHLYIQLIDDQAGRTLAAVSDHEFKTQAKKKAGKSKREEQAKALGRLIAAKVKKASINEVVFDRGRYAYHGAVKALAEGAREGGLKF